MLTSIYVLPRDKTLALNPNTTRERSSRSYMRLLRVCCRPFHPLSPTIRLACQFIKLVLTTLGHELGVTIATPNHVYNDSSLFPSLTLRWAVITCYASLCSPEVPLVLRPALTSRSTLSSNIISFSFLYLVGATCKNRTYLLGSSDLRHDHIYESCIC